MSPERDDPIDDQDHELYEDVAPRSIFAATWFRVVLVVIVLGVVGAVAVPYVLDWMNPPPIPRTAATTTTAPLTPTMPAAAETPASERPPADSASGESAVAEKKGSTMATATARPSAASSSATAAAESKPAAKAVTPETKAEPQRSVTSGNAKGKTATAVSEKAATPSAAKPTPATKPETAAKTAPKRVVAKATISAPVAGGPYWVQIGAFKDAESAKRVAAKLREENFKVEESIRKVGGAAPARTGAPAAKGTPPATTADQYDVLVSGMSVEELNRRLAGKGLAAEGAGSSGLVVKPSLPLRDAVTLSKDLAVDGFKVQVRRAGAAASAPAVVSAPSPAPAAGPGEQLHRVRVGAFTDRAAAVAAARELESKGFKPYIARGDQ